MYYKIIVENGQVVSYEEYFLINDYSINFFGLTIFTTNPYSTIYIIDYCYRNSEHELYYKYYNQLKILIRNDKIGKLCSTK